MSKDRNLLEAKAADLAEGQLEWNELDFVGWNAFRRMAPSVIALERTRLGRLLRSLETGSDPYNALVRARYELSQFADGIESSPRESVAERAEHLRRALLAVSLLAETCDDESLRYVIQRLTYVHRRLTLIY